MDPKEKEDMSRRTVTKTLALVSLVLVASVCFAVTDLKGVAGSLKSNFTALAQLITAGAYLAGMGFAMAAILKFKQHKDNPTQIPVGTPIAMLFVAAALLFLPKIMEIAGKSVFGEDVSTQGVSGTDTIMGG